MTEIMHYYTLVERDTKLVGWRWKGFIILLLFLLCVSSLIRAITLHQLFLEYNENCFISSDIRFRNRSELYTDIKIELPEGNKRNYFDAADVDFLNFMVIDEFHSNWNHMLECDFLKTMPMVVVFSSTVWIILFIVCGNGGHKSAFIPQPWTIVVPALCWFLFMFITTLISVIYSQSQFAAYCNQIQQYLTGHYACSSLIGHFSLLSVHHTSESADYKILYEFVPTNAAINYILIIATAWTNVVLWLVTVVTMILRCVFMIDFKLVRVTVSTIPPKDTVVIAPSKLTLDKIDISDDSEYEEATSSKKDADDETSFTTARSSLIV